MPFDPSTVKLGRLVNHDERSRNYGITIRDGVRLNSVTWDYYGRLLHQTIGSCTGDASAGWKGCAPHCLNTTDAAAYDDEYADKVYRLATRLDPFPGEYPPTDTGSSGNAAAKAMRQLGDIRSWSWAFSTRGLLTALQTSPVMIGTAWTDRMFSPDSGGFIHPSGTIQGGHEYLVYGVHLGPTPGDQWLECRNSWGEWGTLGDGRFRLRLADWERLRPGADITIPHI